MNIATPAFHAKIQATYPLRDTFEAWRLRDGPTSQRLDIDAEALAGALAQAQASCGHRDTLFIVQTHARTEKRTLHAWRIRQGARSYRTDPLTGIPGFVHPLKPDALFSMDVDAFAPVEPWKYASGADVVGFDRATVEAR